MFAESFEYHAPDTLKEATALLGKYKDEAKVITGGMSLIPLMKLRLAAPSHLVDLRKLADLRTIKQVRTKIEIGALATYDMLEQDKLLRAKCPLVSVTAAEVGDVQVRNRGTIGGALVHADPAGDLVAAIMALDGTVTLSGRRKDRTLPIAAFIEDAMLADIKPDEILTKITVPTTSKKVAYAKLAQQASGFALVGVAVSLDMQGKKCKSARVGVTGVTSKAFRAGSVEKALKGKVLDAATIAEAADLVAKDIDFPLSDPLNGSGEYRIQVAKVYTKRAIQAALG